MRLGFLLGFPGLGLALVLIAVLVLGGQQLQQRPGFCATCHGTSNENWRSSGAAENHPICIECHSGAGIVEAITSEFKGGYRIAQFFGGADPAEAKAHVPNGNCLKCHSDRAEVVKAHHKAYPAQAGLSYCSNCHEEQIRGSGALSGRQKECSGCHSHSGESPFEAPSSRTPR